MPFGFCCVFNGIPSYIQLGHQLPRVKLDLSRQTHKELGDPVHRRQVNDVADDVEPGASDASRLVRVVLDELANRRSEPRLVLPERILRGEQRLSKGKLALRGATRHVSTRRLSGCAGANVHVGKHGDVARGLREHAIVERLELLRVAQDLQNVLWALEDLGHRSGDRPLEIV